MCCSGECIAAQHYTEMRRLSHLTPTPIVIITPSMAFTTLWQTPLQLSSLRISKACEKGKSNGHYIPSFFKLSPKKAQDCVKMEPRGNNWRIYTSKQSKSLPVMNKEHKPQNRHICPIIGPRADPWVAPGQSRSGSVFLFIHSFTDTTYPEGCDIGRQGFTAVDKQQHICSTQPGIQHNQPDLTVNRTYITSCHFVWICTNDLHLTPPLNLPITGV